MRILSFRRASFLPNNEASTASSPNNLNTEDYVTDIPFVCQNRNPHALNSITGAMICYILPSPSAFPPFCAPASFFLTKGRCPPCLQKKEPLGAECTTRAAPVVDAVDLGVRPLLGPKTSLPGLSWHLKSTIKSAPLG